LEASLLTSCETSLETSLEASLDAFCDTSFAISFDAPLDASLFSCLLPQAVTPNASKAQRQSAVIFLYFLIISPFNR